MRAYELRIAGTHRSYDLLVPADVPLYEIGWHVQHLFAMPGNYPWTLSTLGPDGAPIMLRGSLLDANPDEGLTLGDLEARVGTRLEYVWHGPPGRGFVLTVTGIEEEDPLGFILAEPVPLHEATALA